MHRTVVIPVARGDHATTTATTVDHGVALARQLGAGVRLLTVRPAYVEHATARRELAGIAAGHGIDDVLVVDASDPARAIARIGSEAGHLVCMGSHGRRPLAELALGSVSAQVVRTCRRPVVLVGPHCGPAPDAYRSMTVPLDGSKLAETILPVAVRWSRRLDVTPWLFEVLPARVPLEVADAHGDVDEASYVHRLAEQLGVEGVPAAWDIVHDRHPAAAIARFAETRGPGLIALSTHGRSGLGQLAMGSVALAVAHRATSPVLVHHPQAGRPEETS